MLVIIMANGLESSALGCFLLPCGDTCYPVYQVVVSVCSLGRAARRARASALRIIVSIAG
jgi:hypothetical protein